VLRIDSSLQITKQEFSFVVSVMNVNGHVVALVVYIYFSHLITAATNAYVVFLISFMLLYFRLY
jgi:hypothetical protein